jgi:hypothetical protein
MCNSAMTLPLVSLGMLSGYMENHPPLSLSGICPVTGLRIQWHIAFPLPPLLPAPPPRVGGVSGIVCVPTGGWRVGSLGAGRGAVGGGREGGYREEGRKIWFPAQGFDRPSPDVCVCVCGREVACADGG